MPLRNVRGYALALTTARYYTPSGRSIQRDYGATALEDYVAPKDRRTCDEVGGEAKLTDAGRKVYGGDGITPDYCVEPETPSKFVGFLISRQAFLAFSRGYAAPDTTGNAKIAGAGSRSTSATANGKVKVIGRDFEVTDQVLADFKNFLVSRKIRHTDEELAAHREDISRQILEDVVRQVFGEAESRKRTLAWDPQVKKALELTIKAELLLRNPQQFIAERGAEARVASSVLRGATQNH
jgi:carboxyl-terminal processing protease